MYDWRRMTDAERREVLACRKAAGHPWHRPPDQDWGERAYHVTAACFEHAPIMGASPARMADFADRLLDALEGACQHLHAWCVLPNHYHVLAEARTLRDMTAALGRLHGRTSFEWNGEDRARGRKVWYSCENRAIRSERHFWATTNYVHYNPVHHGYVTRWDDWPFSSAQAFLDEVGREEAARIWRDHPLLDYGKGWDDPQM